MMKLEVRLSAKEAGEAIVAGLAAQGVFRFRIEDEIRADFEWQHESTDGERCALRGVVVYLTTD